MGSLGPKPPTTPLLSLLRNPLILYHFVPYLPISGLLNLSATSKSFYHLIYDTPNVFRYLDLSTLKGASVSFGSIDPGGEVWRSERMDESVTEEDFFAGPLRGIFASLKRKGVLQDVRTLILDGLSVPAAVLTEIFFDEPFNVIILSIRNVKNLHERKLMEIIKRACGSDRAHDPKIKGIYFFCNDGSTTSKTVSRHIPNPGSIGPTSVSEGITTSLGAALGAVQRSTRSLMDGPDPWYTASGALITPPVTAAWNAGDWGKTLAKASGLIAFDAVLCRAPNHDATIHDEIHAHHKNDQEYQESWIPAKLPRIAAIALGPGGCQICHSAPEGPIKYGQTLTHLLPLLSPPPLHSSSIIDAQRVEANGLNTADLLFYARCKSCLPYRWCEGCGKFWWYVFILSLQFITAILYVRLTGFK
ncbi:MAG: hypothetical protein MMC33_007741 [Icmadophila ericetorum]|nr:hypothetical protein [Icmadophila ericetorum]